MISPPEFRDMAIARLGGFRPNIGPDAIRAIFERGHIHDTGKEGNPDAPVYGLKVVNLNGEVHTIQVHFPNHPDPIEVEVCDIGYPRQWTAESMAAWIYVIEKYLLPRKEEIALVQAKKRKGHCPVCGEKMKGHS